MFVRETLTAIGRLMLVCSVMIFLLILALPDLSQAEQRLDEGRSGGQAVDPIVGTWFCTNNALSYNINFQVNGQLVAGEAFLGNTRSNNWIRMGEDRISIPGGPQFEIRFDDPNNFSYRDVNVGSAGTCRRQ